MAKFINPRDPDNLIITQKIKEWVKAIFQLTEQDLIFVTEFECFEPGCMGAETHLLIEKMDYNEEKRQKKQFRILKPLTYIRLADIQNIAPQNPPKSL